MNKNETKANTNSKGESDNKDNAIYVGHTLKDLIMGLLIVVRMEIEDNKKSIDATDDELVAKVLDKIEQDRRTFSNDKEKFKYYGAVTHEVVWNYLNTVESEYIIRRLKSGDRLFAQNFFYGKSEKECNISRIRSKIIAQIKQTYHYDVRIEEFGSIVYTHLWNNGTWSVLDSYAKKGNFFSWLEQVAHREVMRILKEMKVINVSRKRTKGNTRLLGASISPYVWEVIITDLMPEGLHKNLLMASYVERKSEQKMTTEFGLEAEILHLEINKAEMILKDKLIRGDGYYEKLVLRDKNPGNVEVSEDFINEFVEWQEEKSDISPLADIFGVNLDKENLNEKIVDFLYRFSEKLKWSDEDKLIWRLRFIENVAPIEVAERCGKARAWLDTRYFRLNQKFNIAIREWWKNNS